MSKLKTEFRVAYKISGTRRHTIRIKAISAYDAVSKVLDAITRAQVQQNRFINVDFCEVIN